MKPTVKYIGAWFANGPCWRVSMQGKKPCDFSLWWVAIDFAIRAYRYPAVMQNWETN